MSKKMMKRSLALGALMAFVITGSAMAAEVSYSDFVNGKQIGDSISVTQDTIVKGNGVSAEKIGNYVVDVADSVNLKLDNVTKASSGLYIKGNGNVTIYNTGTDKVSCSGINQNANVTVNNLSIYAHNDAQRNDKGITMGYGNNVTIVANNSVNIDSGDIGIHTEGVKEGKATVSITTKDFTLNSKGAAIVNSYINDVIINATGDVEMTAVKGLQHTGTGKTRIAGNNITLNFENYGVNAFYADNGTVQLDATNDLTITNTGDKSAIWNEKNSSIELTAGRDILINGNVKADAGNILIDAVGDTTIDGTVQGADGLKSQIDLKGNNVTITAKATTPSETEGAVRNVSIDAKGKVTINAEGLCGVGAGPDKATMAQAMNSIKAKEINITSDNAFGIYANNHSYYAVGTRVHSYLEAETINIESKKDGIYASNGAVTEVKGFKTLNVTSTGEQGIGSEYGHLTFVGGDVVVTSAEEGIRSKLGGELEFDVDSLKVDAGSESIKLTGDSVLNIKANTVQLIGDITTETANGKNPNLTVAFNDAESYLNGKVTTVDGAQTNLTFNKGATWNVSGESNVSTLISNKGKIVFEDDSHVHIDAGSGDLDITKKDLTAESINGLSKEEVADKFDSVAKQLGVKDAANAPKATVVVAEGDVVGEFTGEVVYSETAEHEYYHGTVTEVTEKVNTKNQAIGDTGIALKLHWRAHMNDMNKRMGELRNAEGEHGVWARMVRGESEYKNTKAQYNQYQLGYDEKLSVDERWTVGAAVTFAEGDANYGQGSTDDKSTAFAIYGSKLNNDGTFVDLIARYAHLESDLDDVNSGKGDYATNGMSVSAEFGKRIQQGNGLWIEPQVELTYGTIDSAEFKFDSGKAVQVGDMDSLIGRVGFRIGKDLEQGNVYARASYLYDFEGETENAFSKDDVSRTIAEDLGGGWWEVGVGANVNLSKATYVYADVEKTFGGEVDTNWQWNLGVRYSF